MISLITRGGVGEKGWRGGVKGALARWSRTRGGGVRECVCDVS